MATPPRRLLARYPCDVPVEVFSFISEALVAQGRFINISVGGARFDGASPLERGVTYFFRLLWKKKPVELPGRVVWAAPHQPRNPKLREYGIQFNLIREQENLLRTLVESLRRLVQAPEERNIMRDYWKPRG